MIDINLLEQLSAVEKYETLSNAAEHLHISQSALSRSMKQIENVLDVDLFIRKKNRIYLNSTGKFAAEYAEKILIQNKNFIENVREFDRKSRTISIGCCAPVPMNELIFLLNENFPGVSIMSELNNDEYLIRSLENNLFDLVILRTKLDSSEFISKKIGSEKLFIVLPSNHQLNQLNEIHLENLNGQSILLYSKIGFWYDLCKIKAPQAKFLMQDDRDTFIELANSLAFPFFTTDILMNSLPKNCICKSIVDNEANVDYYCICRRSKQNSFHKLFSKIKYNDSNNRFRYVL